MEDAHAGKPAKYSDLFADWIDTRDRRLDVPAFAAWQLVAVWHLYLRLYHGFFRWLSGPRLATAIGDGLSLGVDMVSAILDKKRTIILLSDGIQNSGLVSIEQATQYAVINNVQVHTIGIGSEKPVYVRDDIYGEPQYAELDEDALKNISNSTGGSYFKSLDEQTLNEIVLELSSNIEYETELSTIRDWFIGSAIGLILLNMYIIYGKYRIIA